LYGESPDLVAQRLADTINAHHSRQTHRIDYDPHWLWRGGFKANASGPSVTLPLFPAAYVLAGTETGLGIPDPPLSLTCSYNDRKDEIKLNWINPPERYDYILVNYCWTDFDHLGTYRLPGTTSKYIFENAKAREMDLNDMDFRVIGVRNNIPSNASYIHVSNKGHCQAETHTIPFTNGIAPNWSLWTTGVEPKKGAFEEGEKYPRMPGYTPNWSLVTKHFYQVINAPAKGVANGIYRKFLGLTPEHTYRLTACLSTLDMDSIQADWSFSLHATHNGAGRKDLTAQQLAGSAALPDGKRGPQAGRIASYHKGKTTKAAYDIVFSGDKAASEVEDASHITLPADANEITVWVRFSCSDPKGKVGFSGVKLEDITANPNIVSPEGVVNTERQAEIDLLRGEEQELKRHAEIELLQREEKALQRDFEREQEKAKQK
jgi:hypothetical protein